jgi:hypothetical protein
MNILVGISDKSLKVLADGISKSLLPVVSAGEMCILVIISDLVICGSSLTLVCRVRFVVRI